MKLQHVKIAIVCDWLTNMGGAEKVILALHKLFPDAPIYTSLYNPQKVRGFENATVIPSFLQKFPFAKNKHQMFLSFMPYAFESMDLRDFDIVISSSHSCAKGIITKPQTLHICYCHSPMRYAWDDGQRYIDEYQTNFFTKKIAHFLMHKIRMWDRLSADRVDKFVANSSFIGKRILKYYHRDSEVIHPFVDTSKYEVSHQRSSFYLAVGRLTPYKRFDLVVRAFNDSGKSLKIVGNGVTEKYLRQIAGPNIEFLGYVSEPQLKKLYAHAQALIFPQIEDFGITPLEAMATGCPVIAFAQGGALETVVHKKSGILFDEQSIEGLKLGLREFESTVFDPKKVREQAEKFDIKIFEKKLLDFISTEWENWQTNMLS